MTKCIYSGVKTRRWNTERRLKETEEEEGNKLWKRRGDGLKMTPQKMDKCRLKESVKEKRNGIGRGGLK